MNKLAAVYANSLFEAAFEEKADKDILQQAQQMLDLFDREGQLVKVLDAPTVTKAEKEQLLDSIFKDETNRYLLNFLKVMTDRKAVLYIKEALESYIEIYNKHYGIQKVVAVTAVEMSDELKEKLVQKLQKTTGKTILLENKVDKSAIGGVVLKFGDVQLDSSIAEKLKNIKEELSKI